MIDIGHTIAMHGYMWDTKDFFNTVARIWLEDFKREFRTVENLLCHPNTAKVFSDRVRTASELPHLEDSDILTCLMNLRKRKWIDAVAITLRKNSQC